MRVVLPSLVVSLSLGCASAAPTASPAPEPLVQLPPLPAEAPMPIVDHPEGAKTGADAPIDVGTVDAPTDGRPRLGAVDFQAYIYKKPAREGLPLGYVRIGTSVPLLDDKPVEGKGCGRGFYKVAPRGYICLDFRTTRDLEDPYFRALAEVAPTVGATWSYRYAFSNGAPMYSRLPTAEEQLNAERDFGAVGSFQPLPQWSKGHEELIVPEKIVATDPVPELFKGPRTVFGGLRNPKTLVWRKSTNGTLLAYARAFEANGRVWLLTPDLMLVPADRTRSLRRSTFHGVMLGDEVTLPLAWNRSKQAGATYHRDDAGHMSAAAGTFAPKSPLQIVDARTVVDGATYYEVKGQPGTFVAESEVTISRARTELPRGIAPDQRWIDVKIGPGTLTAYEGLTPVRATMFSPGRGGIPAPNTDHTKYATTAIGFFPIEWKERVATMTSENGEPKLLWYTDVPNIQYLKAPLAMHVAYWHEDFGNPKSAECVNVAPEDGRWLFGWTLPALPEGWGAIRPGDGNGPSTPVVISAF